MTTNLKFDLDNSILTADILSGLGVSKPLTILDFELSF